MDTKTRLDATKIIWGVLGLIMVAVFIGAGIGEGLQTGHVIMGVATLIAATASTGFIWNPDHKPDDIVASASNENLEKIKRERLDAVLRNLSNEELLALKSRLSDGSIDDDLLYEHMTLSDDGELIPMDKR